MTTSDTIERHFTLESPGELSVRGQSGEVTVRGWSESIVRVRAEGNGDDLSEEDLHFTKTGSRLSITAGYGGGAPVSVDYEIDVPFDCRVSVATINGDISLEGIRGGGEIDTPSGDVNLARVAGDYAVKTANGDVTVEEMTGFLHVTTANGDIDIERSALTGFNFNSASGDVTVETSLAPQGEYRFHTASGDLALLIPGESRATVKLHTQSGDPVCELPAQIIRSSRRNWEAILNGGGAVVEMHSVSGDIKIEEADHDLPVSAWTPGNVRTMDTAPVSTLATEPPPTADATEPLPAAPATTSTAILDALARGEIGVDEAMAKLDALQR